MVALNGHDDQLLFAFLHVFIHAPGLAVGCVRIEKYIVTVEHIHHGIPTVRLLTVGSRQINIGSALGFPGKSSLSGEKKRSKTIDLLDSDRRDRAFGPFVGGIGADGHHRQLYHESAEPDGQNLYQSAPDRSDAASGGDLCRGDFPERQA